MYQSRVTRTPRSVERTISSTDEFPRRKPDSWALRHNRSAMKNRGRGLRFHFFCGGARVHQVPRHALIDQQHALPGFFTVERRARLQRVYTSS